MNYKTTYNSPLGKMTLGSDGECLIGIWNEGQKYHGDTLFRDWVIDDSLPVFSKTKEWLDLYFDGKNPSVSGLKLNPIGSEFRKAVWQILREIPYGEVTSYGKVAKDVEVRTGKKTSARAVGGAVGHNPILIIIPCHRVVGTNGSLTGFAGGLNMKTELLKLENSKEFLR